MNTQKPGSDTQLSVQELLKPRYKVIADYPGNYWTVDNVIVFEQDDQGRPVHYLWDNDGRRCFRPSFFDEYPHLFKKLQWWEERKIEEMPEYLRVNPDKWDHSLDRVEKVSEYFGGYACANFESGKDGHLKYWLPATKEEYDNQQPAS